MSTNRFKFTRVPGRSTHLSVHLALELDASDPKAMDRLGKIMRELVPEEDRDEFLTEMREAAVAAGILPGPLAGRDC